VNCLFILLAVCLFVLFCQLNLEVSNWGFCDSQVGACLARGEFLEVDLAIQALNEVIQTLSPTTFYLGQDAVLMASSEVEVDGNFQAMPQGYPQVFQPDLSKANDRLANILRIRFPRFTSTAFWDAVIS
jgi:hypothetical protein